MSKRRGTFVFGAETWRQLRLLAADRGVSMTEMIRRLIAEAFTEWQRKSGVVVSSGS